MKLATFHCPLQIGVDYLRPLPPSRYDQAAPASFNPRRPHNIGDWYLTKIIDRVLDFDELIVLFNDSTDALWDEVNASCDALVLRGGNFISPAFLSTTIGIANIERIKIPIVLFGAGIQEVPRGGLAFEDEEIAILRYIHRSCASSAVRGDLTADVLASIGIHNTVVTGCPTFYWSRQPSLTVRRPGRHRAGFTFRHGLFTADDDAYRSMFRALEWTRERYDDVTVFLQGEEVVLQQLHHRQRWGAEHRVLVTREPGHAVRLRREPLDVEHLVQLAHQAYSRWASTAMIDWLIEHSFFSWDISDYIDALAEQDLVIGCRLHANLLALAHGTPAYYLTYDDRTREIVDFLGVPACPLREFDANFDVALHDWGPVEERYRAGFRRFGEFLEANGLDHCLDVATASTTS